MFLFAVLMYFAAVISGYAAAMALLLCPWLAKGCDAVSLVSDRFYFTGRVSRFPGTPFV